MNEYSSDKAVFHHDRLHILDNGGQPPPVHVLLVISDLCSHDCAFCMYRVAGYGPNTNFGVVNQRSGVVNNNPNRMIPSEKVIEIFDDCQTLGVKAITFTGGGEPTVHPQFDVLLQAALSRGFDVSLITHAVLLSESAINDLMNASWVRISVDAATAATYSKIRRVSESQFSRALRSISALVKAKRTLNSTVVIGMSFVTTKDNYLELADAAALARELGVDTFRISAEFGPQGTDYFAGIETTIMALCEKAVELETHDFRIINQWPIRIADLALGAPDYRTCWYQNFTTFIGGDQNVYRCCTTSYNNRGLIGSLKGQSFLQLWNSDEKAEKFAQFDARGCTYCHVNDRNRAIQASLDAPLHAAFV